MSQVIYQTRKDDHDIQVVTGWDRPLQHHFLTVLDQTNEKRASAAYKALLEDLDAGHITTEQFDELAQETEEEFPCVIYCEMDDVAFLYPDSMSATDVVVKLQELEIPAPACGFDGLLHELHDERRRDDSNNTRQLASTL